MKRLPITLCLALAASPAFAHLPPGDYGSVAAGFSHPLFGPDHVLAMVTVGLWAGFLGGRAVWMVPAAFVSFMIIGFVLALSGLPLPMVEPVILASTVVLGLVVATAANIDTRTSAVVVGFFAVFHGYAHGGEIGEAAALRFGLGFAIATAALHITGIGLGLASLRAGRRFGSAGAYATRGIGGLAALIGLGLAIG